MERTKNPVIFSHSNPLAIHKHRRNIRDDAIKACAKTDGVVHINGIGDFLGKNDSRSETMVRHIDYVVNLVGARHVGLGFDFVFDQAELEDYLKQNPQLFPAEDGYGSGAMNIAKPEQMPEIVEGMVNLGYKDADIIGILGGNHLRVAERVWK